MDGCNGIMRRHIFLIIIAALSAVFFLWSPFGQGQGDNIYAENEGKLLLPQNNVAIVTLNLEEAGLSFTSAKDILALRVLQQDFIELDGVTKVESILSASRVISRGEDILVESVIPSEDAEISDGYLQNLTGEIGDFPELAPFINDEQNTCLFYISYANRTAAQNIYRGLSALRGEWMDSIPFDFTGRAPIIAATESLLTKDIALFFPLLAVIIAIILSLFRSFKVVVMSLVLILITMAASYSFVRFIGISDSPLLLLIPVFGLGLLSDYIIHYFYHRLHAADEFRAHSARGILWFPLSLTALSTLIGFLSLSLINGSGHVQLSVLIAFAVVVTWIGVFYWMDYGRYKPMARPLLRNFQRFQGRLFMRIAKYRYLFFIIIAAAAAWGVMELKNISIEPYPIEQLPESTTIKRADRIINDKFFGSVPFFIEIDSGEKNGMMKKDTLAELERIHRRMDEGRAGFSYSILTVLKRMHYYFMGDEQSLLTGNEYDDIYDALIEQYLLYYSSGVDPLEYESMVDSSYRVFSIRGFLHYRDYDDLHGFMALLGDLSRDFPGNWSLEVHGMAMQLEDEHTRLRRNWLFSFLGGGLLIFVTVWLFYKKLSLALLSLIPGFIGMVISFGFINLAGISIDAFSIIFVAIITGLVIDYSIHTLVALNRLGAVNDLESGFGEIIGFSGIPIFLSFLTSVLSFSILFLSSFSGARNLGFLLLLSLVLSFILSLYLIPLIILPIRLRRNDV